MAADEGRTLQLRLSLSSNTSFKRSFEELFGGAESDEEGVGAAVGAGDAAGAPGSRLGGLEGRSRNKRQRSGDGGPAGREDEEEAASDTASSVSGSSSSSSNLSLSLSLSPASTGTASSSGGTLSDGMGYSVRPSPQGGATASTSGVATTTPMTTNSGTTTTIISLATHESLPPRLPTPRLDDVQMSDIPLLDNGEELAASGVPSGAGGSSHLPRTPPVTTASSSSTTIPNVFPSSAAATLPAPTPLSEITGERFRATMERYNAFESAMAALRRPHTPPRPVAALGSRSGRPGASPPRLPPLQLSSREEDDGERRAMFNNPRLPVPPVVTTPFLRGPSSSDYLPTTTSTGSDSSLSIHGTTRTRTQVDFGLGGSRAVGDTGGDSSDEGEDNGEDSNQTGSGAVGDVPPRIELSNSVWSSLGIGRGDTAVEDDEDDEAEEEEGTELVYPDPPFRDRLDSALEALRSPSSPLVPGLVSGDSGEGGITDLNTSSASPVTPTSNGLATVQRYHTVVTSAANSGANNSPPTLPPIFTDRDGEIWRRDPNVQEEQTALDGQDRQRGHGVQRLGEVQLPSPSLSGFYAWLDEASANVAGSGARSSSPTPAPRSVPVSAPASGSIPSARPNLDTMGGEMRTQTQNNGGMRSWEDDVLAGFLNSEINLGLERREGLRGDPSIGGPPGPSRLQREDSSVMDVDMESDTERERQMERLHWPLGSSLSSSDALRLGPNSDWVRRPTWSSISNGPPNLRRNVFNERNIPNSYTINEAGPSPAPPPPSSSPPSVAHQPTYSPNLFSPSSPPYHTSPLSTSASPSRPTMSSGSSRIRLPRHISSPSIVGSHTSYSRFSPSPELEHERFSLGTSRLSLSSNSSGDSYPHYTLNSELRELREPTIGMSTGASLPPTITLNLNLNNSALSTNFTPNDNTDNEPVSPLPENTNNGSMGNVDTGVIHHTTTPSVVTAAGPPSPSTTNADSTTSSYPYRSRYRVSTRLLASSNSLVAENAAEMRRRTARADLSRRLGALRPRGSSVSSGSGTLGPNFSGGIFSRGDEAIREQATEPREEREDIVTMSAGGRVEDVEGPGAAPRRLLSQIYPNRDQIQSRIQTQTRYTVPQPQTHTQIQPQRASQQRSSLLGGSFGTFGGLGLPPRSQTSQTQNSFGQIDTRGQSASVSAYPGVQPPPPRPRYHSVRNMHHTSESVRTERSDARSAWVGNTSGSGEGHRRGVSWSEGSTTSTHTSLRSLLSGPGVNDGLTNFRLIPGSGSGSRSNLGLEDQQRRNLASSGSSSVSGSSLSSVPYRPGSTSGISSIASGVGGTMFLDTELPSPGLGLFDVLESGTGSESTGPSMSAIASSPTSPSTSALTFSSNSSEFLSSSAGRHSASPPVTNIRGQNRNQGIDEIDDESVRLQRLAQRLGNVRDGVNAEMQRGRPRWRSDNAYEIEAEEQEAEQGRDEMDVDEEGRGIGNRASNDFFTDFGSSALMRARPDLFGPSSQSSSESSRPPSLSNSNLSTRVNASPERSSVIDPSLFAPGPFRNTMELASRAREYAASASSIAAPSRSAPTSSPLSFSSSPSPPSISPPAMFVPVPSGTNPGSGSRHRNQTSNAHMNSGMTHAPPVIPPLAFESDSTAERSEVQEPLNPLSRAREFPQLSEELLERSASQGRVRWREIYQQFQQFQRRGSGEHDSSSGLSSSTSSSSLQLSLSQLENSPSRSVSGMSLSDIGEGSRRGSGEMEGLQHAIGVLSADGLSVGRSMQFLERYRIESGRAQNQNQSQDHTHGQRTHNQNRNGDSGGNVPRWRYGQQMYHQHQQQLQYQGIQASSNMGADNSGGGGNSNTGDGGNVQMGGRRGANPSWREIIWNPEEEDRESENEDLIMHRPQHGARERRESQISTQSQNPRRRLSLNLRLGTMPFERDAGGSGTNASGNGGGSRGEVGRGGGLMRERVFQRLGFGQAGRFGMPSRRGVADPGDYMNDEEFDASYESLLSLQAALGEVKPRSTPEAVLKRLQSAKYREWVSEESDKRCPICLDEYSPDDMVMKPGQCAHWLHKECLEQWLKGANTCPVCRSDVEPQPQRGSLRYSRHRLFSRRDGPGSGGSGSGSSGSNGGNSNAGSGSGPTTNTRFGPFF